MNHEQNNPGVTLPISEIGKMLRIRFRTYFILLAAIWIVIVVAARLLVTHPSVSDLANTSLEVNSPAETRWPDAISQPLVQKFEQINIEDFRRNLERLKTSVDHPSIMNAFSAANQLLAVLDNHQEDSETEVIECEIEYTTMPGEKTIDWRKADHIAALKELQEISSSYSRTELSPVAGQILELIASIAENTIDHHVQDTRTLKIRVNCSSE